MKKIIFLGIAFLTMTFCFSDEMIFSLNGSRESSVNKSNESEIELLPNSTVFSTGNTDYIFPQLSINGERSIPQEWPMKYKDKIKIYNLSYDENIDIDFYGYNSKTQGWDFAGNCYIHFSSGEKEGVMTEIAKPFGTVKNAKLKNYVLFAGVSKNGHLYEYKVRSVQNDLYVYIVSRSDEIQDDYKSGAYIISTEKLGKLVKSSIEIENDSKKDLTVVVYGFTSSEDENWDRIWTVEIDKRSDEDLEGPYLGQLSKYRYFAVTNKEHENVNYEVEISGKKLVINIK